jgi:Tol biopolymer transport system component
MKRCPECRKNYFDDSLAYCLDDGAALVQGSVTDEPATAILSGDRNSDENLTASLRTVDTSTRPNSVTFRLPAFLSRERFPWIVASVLLLGLFGTIIYIYRNPRIATLSGKGRAVLLIQSPRRNAGVGQLAISPDGRSVAVVATFEGTNRIWIRPIDSLEGRALPGTDGAGGFPFWSPDGRSIGFLSRNKLKRIDLSDGTIRELTDVGLDVRGFGGTWNRDGVILSQQGGLGILRISASDGAHQTLPGYEARADGIDRWPAFLPDGRHFIFLTTSSTDQARSDVYVGSIDSPERKLLFASDTNAFYSASPDGKDGYLLFARGGALLAQGFDPASLQVKGEPFRVAERIRVNFNNRAYFSISDEGTIVYDPTADADEERQLTWYDRTGKELQKVLQSAAIFRLRLSPDEKFVSTSRRAMGSFNNDVLVSDIARGASARLSTYAGVGDTPETIWSPDGKYVVWNEYDQGKYRLMKKLATGAGQAELLFESPVRIYPSDWSPDGKFILYSAVDNTYKNDIWVLPLDGDRRPWLYFQSPGEDRFAVFSPDGKYIAYSSDDGRTEIYLQTFPSSTYKRTVSTNGGSSPRWPRKGHELFYVQSDGKIMAVPITSGDPIEAGVPQPLFDIASVRSPRNDDYAVSNDGQRLLFISRGTDAASTPLVVILNWSAGLNK